LLDRHGILGCKRDSRTVVDRPEQGPFLADLRFQRKDLISAGVGEDRPVPRHEAVQASQLRDSFGPGSQHQVVRVGEDHLGTDLSKIVHVEGSDRGSRSDRHKSRSLDGAMGQFEYARPRLSVASAGRPGRSVGHAPGSRSTSIASPKLRKRYPRSNAVSYARRQRGPMNAATITIKLERGI